MGPVTIRQVKVWQMGTKVHVFVIAADKLFSSKVEFISPDSPRHIILGLESIKTLLICQGRYIPTTELDVGVRIGFIIVSV